MDVMLLFDIITFSVVIAIIVLLSTTYNEEKRKERKDNEKFIEEEQHKDIEPKKKLSEQINTKLNVKSEKKVEKEPDEGLMSLDTKKVIIITNNDEIVKKFQNEYFVIRYENDNIFEAGYFFLTSVNTSGYILTENPSIQWMELEKNNTLLETSDGKNKYIQIY